MSDAVTAANHLEVDLVIDLNSEDESGLPWGFIDDARDPELLREGAWVVVGQGNAQAVAQVVEIDGDVVRVRPLPGPVASHRHLLTNRVS
jgi:hypothetical protein